MTAVAAERPLDGRVALVTGAGSGIGQGCAVELASRGATVVCVGRSRRRLAETVARIGAAGGEAVAHPADVSAEAEATAAVARAAELGELSIGVNSAGIASVGDSLGFDAARWDAEFATNVRGTFVVCREIGRRLLARGAPGSIVNLSSTASAAGIPMATAYSATKFAVDGLTKSLAAEWAGAGIRVNAVAPAFVETPLTVGYLSDRTNRSDALARLPIGRFVDVGEVSATVAYLTSDSASGITGHVLRVDGGWTAF